MIGEHVHRHLLEGRAPPAANRRGRLGDGPGDGHGHVAAVTAYLRGECAEMTLDQACSH